MEFKIQPKVNKERIFSENSKTKRIDVLRRNYNQYFGVIDFREALKTTFKGILDAYQPTNKQNSTIADTTAKVLSELINIYRLQLGFNISDIDKYGYFPATVVFLKSKGISQHKMETASKWLIDWNIIQVKYEQNPYRADFKKRYFKINLEVLEKALPEEE